MEYNIEKMITIKELKNSWKKGIHNKRFYLRDTSGANAYGYSYDLVEQEYKFLEFKDENGIVCADGWFWEDIKTVASSFNAWSNSIKNRMGGFPSFRAVFWKEDVKDVLTI